MMFNRSLTILVCVFVMATLGLLQADEPATTDEKHFDRVLSDLVSQIQNDPVFVPFCGKGKAAVTYKFVRGEQGWLDYCVISRDVRQVENPLGVQAVWRWEIETTEGIRIALFIKNGHLRGKGPGRDVTFGLPDHPDVRFGYTLLTKDRNAERDLRGELDSMIEAHGFSMLSNAEPVH